jgi:site-specific recombinase XerD
MTDLERLITGWMEHMFIQKGQRPKGVETSVKRFRQFVTWMEKEQIRGVMDVTRGDVEEWQKSLFYDLGNVNVSRAAKLSAVRSFFRWLKYTGQRRDDPTKGIPTPKIQDKLPQKFTTDELRLLFAAPPRDTILGVRDLAILKTLYAAGPRVSEICNLNLSDIVDTGGYIRLKIIGGKGGKSRMVTMRTNPSRALRTWITIRKERDIDTDAVFVRIDGRGKKTDGRLGVRAIQNILKKYARLVGIEDADAFCHKMRSTFATDLYDSGHDKCPRCGTTIQNVGVFELAALMGHEDPKTTLGYVAISDRVLRKTAIPDKRFNEIEDSP